MTLAGLSNSSTKSKSHLEVHELLDRFELLYDNVSELKDLRRAILDKDLSSIFRLSSAFAISSNGYLIDELRKSVLEENQYSILRLLEFYVNKKSLTTLTKTIKNFPKSNIKDAYSRGQLHSKKWLVSEVEKIGMHLGTVFLCAGWYGTLATMFFESEKIHLDKIRSFDIDPTCWRIAESINKPWVMSEWKFKATTQDIHSINFNEYTYKTLRSDKTERELFDKPNTVINTSCEHIENWQEWWNKIPNGKLCILQSNDYFELPEHINCVKDVSNFKSIAPMATYLYTGELMLGKYTRYMLIGIK